MVRHIVFYFMHHLFVIKSTPFLKLVLLPSSGEMRTEPNQFRPLVKHVSDYLSQGPTDQASILILSGDGIRATSNTLCFNNTQTMDTFPLPPEGTIYCLL
jgi:hypothetical protein